MNGLYSVEPPVMPPLIEVWTGIGMYSTLATSWLVRDNFGVDTKLCHQRPVDVFVKGQIGATWYLSDNRHGRPLVSRPSSEPSESSNVSITALEKPSTALFDLKARTRYAGEQTQSARKADSFSFLDLFDKEFF